MNGLLQQQQVLRIVGNGEGDRRHQLHELADVFVLEIRHVDAVHLQDAITVLQTSLTGLRVRLYVAEEMHLRGDVRLRNERVEIQTERLGNRHVTRFVLLHGELRVRFS